ncbi:hypothetical protein [Rhodococcus qingshengii]|uniref:hypothetical protein n=1 Tax=Rhodococcus qingshengii TaxID=334542 RepID=UPI00237C73D1|nr:hypothetical protein [Rhodococcus qingshengii]WCT05923.1 hypothetical protein PI247_29295 [Rhodococcus qingshengii]
MTDTASTPPSRGSVHLRASWWWSRRDDLANRQLADILARHGHPCADMADPEVLDVSLRAAVQNDDALAELAEWIETTSTRRGAAEFKTCDTASADSPTTSPANSTKNP